MLSLASRAQDPAPYKCQMFPNSWMSMTSNLVYPLLVTKSWRSDTQDVDKPFSNLTVALKFPGASVHANSVDGASKIVAPTHTLTWKHVLLDLPKQFWESKRKMCSKTLDRFLASLTKSEKGQAICSVKGQRRPWRFGHLSLVVAGIIIVRHHSLWSTVEYILFIDEGVTNHPKDLAGRCYSRNAMRTYIWETRNVREDTHLRFTFIGCYRELTSKNDWRPFKQDWPFSRARPLTRLKNLYN